MGDVTEALHDAVRRATLGCDLPNRLSLPSAKSPAGKWLREYAKQYWHERGASDRGRCKVSSFSWLHHALRS